MIYLQGRSSGYIYSTFSSKTALLEAPLIVTSLHKLSQSIYFLKAYASLCCLKKFQLNRSTLILKKKKFKSSPRVWTCSSTKKCHQHAAIRNISSQSPALYFQTKLRAVTKRKLSLLKFLFDWFATETAKQTFEKQRFEKHLSSLSDCQTRTLNRSREAL